MAYSGSPIPSALAGAPQSRNCSCGTYFHSEIYAGADPSPPLLVAYAPKITPALALARRHYCLTYSGQLHPHPAP